MHAIATAAAEIIALINERPTSPRCSDIENVLKRFMSQQETQQRTKQISSEIAHYLDLHTRQEAAHSKVEHDDDEADREGSRLEDEMQAFEKVAWSKNATGLDDLMLLAVIARRHENGILDNVGSEHAYLDQRGLAELLRGVLEVGGRW